MTSKLRRVAAVTLLTILSLVLAAPAAQAAGPRNDGAVAQAFVNLTDWNAFAARALAWLGLADGSTLGLVRIAAPSGPDMDPDGCPAPKAGTTFLTGAKDESGHGGVPQT